MTRRLLVAATASAFMTEYQLSNIGRGAFTYDSTANPHWTFVADGGATYSGFFDEAVFGKKFKLSFEDRINIEKNGQPVRAVLEGRVSRECDDARIEFRDRDSGERWVLKNNRPGGVVAQNCEASA